MTKDEHQEPALQALADLRRVAKLSQQTVAERMGTNRQRVSHIEARFPRIRYDTLMAYIRALGGDIQFVIGSHHVAGSQIDPDPTMAATRDYLATASRRGGNLIYVSSAPTEELPLEQGETEPGSDDTGRGVDHPHTEGDQGDREDGEQP